MIDTERPRRTIRRRLWRLMYDQGWTRSEYDDTLRSKITHALADWHQWYRWGNPVMWLVGRYDSGSAGSPRGRDMWWIPKEYVERPEHQSWLADLEQRHGCYITFSYDVVRQTPDVDWRIFDLQDEGYTIKIGLWPNRPEHKGRIAPLPWAELNREQVRLFLWWYLIMHKGKAQWLGVRPWIYWKALHAAVNDRVPFSCQAAPEKADGGYSHWHCQLKKRHRGPHRYRNYIWPGPGRKVEYAPAGDQT